MKIRTYEHKSREEELAEKVKWNLLTDKEIVLELTKIRKKPEPYIPDTQNYYKY